MKFHVRCLLVLLSLVAALSFSPVNAQAPSDGPGSRMLAFLSPADKAHYLKVRDQVLASNPALKAEQESLAQGRKSMRGASSEEKQAYFQKVMAHAQKMRPAMLKADPTIAPVLDQIDAKMKERMAKRQQQGN